MKDIFLLFILIVENTTVFFKTTTVLLSLAVTLCLFLLLEIGKIGNR